MISASNKRLVRLALRTLCGILLSGFVLIAVHGFENDNAMAKLLGIVLSCSFLVGLVMNNWE